MKITIGALAHVDAGKTSLAESILFKCMKIHSKGNIDTGTTFLDYNSLEKQKGITVFNKEANFSYKGHEYNYIDTPGHNDLSYEANKALNILDAALIIISAIEDIPQDTIKRFESLLSLNIPIFIFVNKMDISRINKDKILQNIKTKLDINCIDYHNTIEFTSLLNDDLLEEYLSTNTINRYSIINHLRNQDFFPVFFGSALKDEGIEELLEYMNLYLENNINSDIFHGYIYKVDEEYTYLKVLSGELLNKTSFNNYKINEIYSVSGNQYSIKQKLEAGDIGAIKGLKGIEVGTYLPEMEKDVLTSTPSLTYKIESNLDYNDLYKRISILNSEQTTLNIHIENRQVYINLNGELHQTIIKSLIHERFNIDISFSRPIIKYKETINNYVYGVGHFEPLRHYAEVIVKLEPYEKGFKAASLIENNYTNTLLSYLNTYPSKGIALNCPLTNIKITIVDIKTHPKHTEGQDLIEALRRAIRQGLSQIQSIILEPYYLTSFDHNDENTNIIISYLTQNKITHNFIDEKLLAFIPVMIFNETIISLKSKLKGDLSYSIEECLYDIANDQQEIIANSHYDYRKDFHNPAGSIFCKAGAGHYVEEKDVINNMHLNLNDYTEKTSTSIKYNKTKINDEELKRVWDNLYKPKPRYKPNYKKQEEREYIPKPSKPLIYLIDGYNLMYQLNEELAYEDLINARNKVIDMVCDFAGYVSSEVVLVFDAYINGSSNTTVERHDNIDIVYTKKGQEADSYIENKSNELKDTYKVIVVTSDHLEQLRVYSNNANIISSRDFIIRYENFRKNNQKLNDYLSNRPLSNLKELLND